MLIRITIADDKYARDIDAFCNAYRYVIENTVTPMTRDEFVEKKLKELFFQPSKAARRQQAVDAIVVAE